VNKYALRWVAEYSIPFLLLHSSRNVSGYNFSEQIGTFIDAVPLLVNFSTLESISQKSNSVLDYVQKHNINIGAIMNDNILRRTYPKLSSLLDGIFKGKKNIKILNMLETGEQIFPSSERFVNVRKQGTHLIFENIECETQKAEELIRYLDFLFKSIIDLSNDR
jgi:hypothetical protein